MLRKVTCCAERILDARSNQLQEMGTAISHAQNKTASCFVHNKLLSAFELLHVKPYRMVDNFRCFVVVVVVVVVFEL